MFKKFLKKQNKVELVAPLSGRLILLENVSDPVFSQKMMGEGIAIIPEDGKILAPIGGTIVQIPASKHAIGLQTSEGIEILIHVGLETVALKGQGFQPIVKEGDQVNIGDPLMDVDLDYIKNNADDIVTPMVITNSNNSDKTYDIAEEKACVAGESIVITIT
ncbi:PTS sugar transporter subunit IIA [Gracilibacillus kekensis]|nr:PTS glucose transporter subunit IIA [Gracilibacillus kekensis]